MRVTSREAAKNLEDFDMLPRLPNTTDERIAFFEQIMQDKNLPLSEKFATLAKFAKAMEKTHGTKAGLHYCGLECDMAEALYTWAKKAMI